MNKEKNEGKPNLPGDQANQMTEEQEKDLEKDLKDVMEYWANKEDEGDEGEGDEEEDDYKTLGTNLEKFQREAAEAGGYDKYLPSVVEKLGENPGATPQYRALIKEEVVPFAALIGKIFESFSSRQNHGKFPAKEEEGKVEKVEIKYPISIKHLKEFVRTYEAPEENYIDKMDRAANEVINKFSAEPPVSDEVFTDWFHRESALSKTSTLCGYYNNWLTGKLGSHSDVLITQQPDVLGHIEGE